MFKNVKHTFRRLRRYRHITGVLMKYGLEEAAEAVRLRYRMRSKGKFSEEARNKIIHRSKPERFRMALEELGPTFIKFGQLLSTRPDLVPEGYIKELEKLQDKVSPVKAEAIFKELEHQLGGKVDEIFDEFDPEPIAAGSIAQVYRAVLPCGTPVVVKIRRPSIVETINTECEILEDIAGLLKVTMFGKDPIDPKKIVAEFTEAVSKEVNLETEKKNQLRFYRNFKDTPEIHIPKIYEDYCCEAVLTMEYIEGIKPSQLEMLNKAGLDPKLIAKRGCNFVMRQIFDLGFFHADPHPGNFFVIGDNVLAPIDYGQTAMLGSQDRELLKQLILSIIDNNADQLIRAFQRAELMPDDTDENVLRRDIEVILNTNYEMPLKDISIGQVIIQTFNVIRKHRLNTPPQFTLMLKSLMTIESFANTLDPQFDIIENIKPFAKKLASPFTDPKQMLKNLRSAANDISRMTSHLPDDMNTIISKVRQGDFQLKVHHEHLENLTNTLDKSSNRISFALITAALLVGSSMLISQDGHIFGILTLQTLGITGYIAAAAIGIWLIVSIIKSKDY
ncbi:putative ubiquinone biosynthesis protein UbiB [Limihaloglobus sulfuriphilus]|uniref:Putative ubiquinone biosynthesis protein UbiB n=1 Tax=Limihaloglobus sulfuriphilus TaxID=1851148 RepID=A0A1Q2MJ05_9BACT|nr:AarF/ABC1/UbiB kinase family protein [Limihaloglobus sulfuriphilus]AQQ72357.1 putative ubiquinone biosynthesis protein UbiB [Limihaloglobus sulfuriphilus]